MSNQKCVDYVDDINMSKDGPGGKPPPQERNKDMCKVIDVEEGDN